MSYYEILGVTPFATNEEIENAYQKIITNDNGEEEDDLLKLEKVHKAFIVLNDYHSRTTYDKQICLDDNNINPNDNINNCISWPKNINIDDNFFIDDNKFSLNSNNSEKYLLDIIKRLENLEKKIDSNFTNFYKEKQIIKTTIKKNGQKIESDKTIINNNGIMETNSKLLIYDNKGKVVNIYRNNQIKNKI